MTAQEKDRIERAIRHIQTAVDVDLRAVEIAVEALTTSTKRCCRCERQLSGIGNLHCERKYCPKCGQAITWEGEQDG